MSETEGFEKVKIPQPALYRVRLVFTRGAELRYVSHLDMQLVWERLLRRAGVPLAFSQGFNPRPRLHQASALPLGFLSRCEITDLWLSLPEGSPTPDTEALVAQIQRAAPPGLGIVSCELVDLKQPALQQQVQSAEYLAEPMDPIDIPALEQTIAQLLAAEELPREKQAKPGVHGKPPKPGKAYDLRPLIESLALEPGPTLRMRLAAREGATGRPEELLAELGQDPSLWRVERINIFLA